MMVNQNMSSSWDDTHPGKWNFLFTNWVLSVQQKKHHNLTDQYSNQIRSVYFDISSF